LGRRDAGRPGQAQAGGDPGGRCRRLFAAGRGGRGAHPRQAQGYRAEIIDPQIAASRGRLVKTTGDGLLAEFASVVDALRCAGGIQSGLAARNADLVATERLDFRIGIHQGDIVVEDGDILGDGVNIAARLEGLAESGGICVSARVQEDAAGKLDLVFDDLGEQSLKNIARPVRVYRVAMGGAAPAPVAPALPLPDRPSIAVLPFQNMSGDPEQEYFADGIVEDIITGLSRIKWLFVIARNSTFIYKGKAVDVKQIGRELGVRYALEGSVRKLGNRVRVSAQLIECASAAHVWAERYDRALDDIFELQDELTISVVGAVEPNLRKAEIERARRKRPGSLDAWDLYLQAMPFAAIAMPEDADAALLLLEQAVRIAPDYAAAHALIAWCHEQRYLRGGLHEATRAAASRHARAAIAAGADDANALAMAAFVIGVVERDFETALDAIDRSLALSPSSALGFGFSSIIRAWQGDDATAIAHAEASIRLSPFDPLIYLPYVGLAYACFFAGRFLEAASAAGRALQANPRFSIPCCLQTAAFVRLGREGEAADGARHLLELQPDFTIASFVSGSPIATDRLSTLADALREAGLPE
jgi:adenylate cyclase